MPPSLQPSARRRRSSARPCRPARAMGSWAPYRRPAGPSNRLRPRGLLEAGAGLRDLRRDLAAEIMIERVQQQLLVADAELGGSELQVLAARAVELHGDAHRRIGVGLSRTPRCERDRRHERGVAAPDQEVGGAGVALAEEQGAGERSGVGVFHGLTASTGTGALGMT